MAEPTEQDAAEPTEQDVAEPTEQDHDKGLRFDLRTMSRRRLLVAAGGAGLLALVGAKLLTGGRDGAAADDTSPAAGACTTTVESETSGPFPADGSNGPDVRSLSGIVRRDIRTSFGTATGTAEGVPLTFSLTVQDPSCAPLIGAAVYVWHCDRDGNYSLYSPGVTDQNYLRGIQVTDTAGTVTFTSIYPACYSGRWPHIHVEVYASLEHATTGTGPVVKTSQLALPEDSDRAVYATAGYNGSVANLGRITLATDMVFGDDGAARELATMTGDDGAARELATMTGDSTGGWTAHLTLTVDPGTTETLGGPGGRPGPALSGVPDGPPPGSH